MAEPEGRIGGPGSGPIGGAPIGGTPPTVLPPVPPPPEAPGGYSGADLDLFTHPYQGRLVNSADLVLTRELADPLWNATPEQTATLELDNADGALTASYLAAPAPVPVTRLLGLPVRIRRYDVRSGVQATRFTGAVVWPRLAAHRLITECAAFDPAFTTDTIPEPVVDTETFPKAVDLGATIPVVFGNVPTMPCPYVRDDLVGSQFDYLIGHGTLAVTALARNGPNDTLYSIQFSECLRAAGGAATAWSEVARTDLYPGYTVVRFALRQSDFNNALHKIYAHVTGLQPERNFALAIQSLLSSATWGLGQAVQASSFTDAAAVLDALEPPLFCDGAMLAPKKAQEWLADLLMVRGMRLGLADPAAPGGPGLTLAVDQPRNTVALALGHDPGDGPKNLVSLRERSGPAPEERIRKLRLSYRLDYVGGTHLQRAVRPVAPTGKTRVITSAFIRDAVTADSVADYLAKRIAYGQDTIEVTVTQEARALEVGDLVSLTAARQGYAGDVLEVVKIAERLTTLTCTLRGRDWSTYAYTPGRLPVDPLVGTPEDFSRTTPAAGTLTFSNSSTVVASDGRVTARLRYAVTLPTTNIQQAKLLYRITGTAEWSLGALLVPGATFGLVEGLAPGTAYDVGLQVLNAFGLVSTIVTDLARTTPSDSSVPSAPDAPIVAADRPGVHVIQDTTLTRPQDYKETVLYRATTNNSAAAVEITRGASSWFGDYAVAYATQYWYFFKQMDLSGNLSPFSPAGTLAGGTARTGTVDLQDAAVTTVKVAADAMTEADIAILSSFTMASAAEQVALTINVPGAGGYCVVDVKLRAVVQHGQSHTFRIRKGTTTGGTQIDFSQLLLSGSAGDTWNGSQVLIARDDSPGAGQAYVLTVEHSTAAQFYSELVLRGQRFKR